MGKIAEYKFFLDNEEVLPPTNWRSIQILATFDQSSVQANISTEEFEFVNETAQKIRNYLFGGLTLATNGIFEGIPFRIQASNDFNSLNVFDGYLDFNTYEEINPTKVKCSVIKSNSLNSLDQRSQANSYGYLFDKGFIVPSNFIPIPVMTEKLDIESDLAMITLSIVLLSIQLAQVTKELTKDIALISSIAVAGLTGIPASLIYAIASALLNAIFATILIVQLIKLVQEFSRLLVPPVHYRQGMRLRKLLEITSSYLGYTFVSPIAELDYVCYLPSKQSEKSNFNSGIPNQNDYGYRLSEMFELCNTLFNARVNVVGNELHLRSMNDSYWVKNSTFQVPNVLDEKKKFNNPDFVARTFISFQTDLNDEWTVEDFTGTNYEIITTPINGLNSENNLMKGLNETSILCALASRKSEYNAVENLLFSLAKLVDKIANFLGANSNLSVLISDRIGAVKISQKIHSLPKLVYLDTVTKKIPANHRELWSAKVLWNNYINYNSFVSNNFGGQKRVFPSKLIPFGFSNFLQTIENSYFITENNAIGKIETIKFTLDDDVAEVDYWQQEIYTINLQEDFIEG